MEDGLYYPTILSSFKMFDYCASRYKKRHTHASSYIKHDDFYYWSRTGNLRIVRNKNEIWVHGNEWPETVRRR